MRIAEKASPVAAVIAALSTLACCLPIGIAGGLGLVAVGAWLRPFRSWLLGAALVLLAVGFLQLYHNRMKCARRSRLSVVLFWVAALIVLAVLLFPQVIANWIAG
jgi:hypothetical protein